MADKVGIKILRIRLETSSQLELMYYVTCKGSSGLISENPVESAIGRRAESDLERCSAMVSVRVKRVNSTREK